MKKYFYLFVLIVFSFFKSEASHIVGAELYYDCLGNNTYLVTFIEYRNCSAGCVNCASYGAPEYIQVFDTSGNYIDSFAAPYMTPDTVAVIDTGGCAYPNDYCIEVATFHTTVILPYTPGGYVLVFQRCCRNNAILNIPTWTGATYFTNIPDTTEVSGCDNKPRFRLISPGLMPIDTPFTFDMSAADPDGDSLAYRLTNSYDGANPTCPDPSPANAGGGCPDAASPPPYLSVSYISPYTITNPTNNPLDSGHLQIDAHTGILSGRVNQTGIFLVAVAADEYRNGTLIGSTLLDFQFIFGGCPIDTTPIVNSVRNIEMQGIKIYSSGGEAVIDLSNQNSSPANISFYNLLGQQVAAENNYTGNIYTRQFSNIPSQYIIAKVQLSTGEVVYKKLLIDSGN
jgi:hypothetical protein